MKTELKKIRKEEKEILERLLQLYLHDLTIYFPIDINPVTCLYEYDLLDKYFEDENNYAYFIKHDNKVIGFVLVDLDSENITIQELFIINNYKNKGFGKDMLYSLLNLHKGNWIIKAVPNSPKAEKFWINSIKEITNDNFNLEFIGKYNRAVLTFSNK